jgi:hypothetical protein
MFMSKLTIALVGATSLSLAACTNQDKVDENANADATENLDALAGDAANDAEAEALGNQADQLNATADDLGNSGDGLEANAAEADAAVNGM